jgi:hypothetical protein
MQQDSKLGTVKTRLVVADRLSTPLMTIPGGLKGQALVNDGCGHASWLDMPAGPEQKERDSLCFFVGKGLQYGTVQAAISAANSTNATVFVAPGIYTESLTVQSVGLSIVGIGSIDSVVIYGQVLFDVPASPFSNTLQNLTIVNVTLHKETIQVLSGRHVFQRVRIHNLEDSGCSAIKSFAPLDIVDSEIQSSSGAAIIHSVGELNMVRSKLDGYYPYTVDVRGVGESTIHQCSIGGALSINEHICTLTSSRIRSVGKPTIRVINGGVVRYAHVAMSGSDATCLVDATSSATPIPTALTS